MSAAAKDQLVTQGGSGQMFDGIARRYDLLNRLLSLGMDQRWRRKTVRAMALEPGHRALDLATGTADLALRIARKHDDVQIVGLDPSERMLEIGRRKVDRASFSERIELVVGDAQALPYEDDSFDAACMAFGIRNVPDRPLALRELARVLRPGARAAILELNEPRRGALSSLARFHMRVVVPRLGALLSGSREYRYLQESVASFPPPEEFAAMMDTAGLAVQRTHALTFGVCQLYVAEVAP